MREVAFGLIWLAAMGVVAFSIWINATLEDDFVWRPPVAEATH